MKNTLLTPNNRVKYFKQDQYLSDIGLIEGTTYQVRNLLGELCIVDYPSGVSITLVDSNNEYTDFIDCFSLIKEALELPKGLVG